MTALEMLSKTFAGRSYSQRLRYTDPFHYQLPPCKGNPFARVFCPAVTRVGPPVRNPLQHVFSRQQRPFDHLRHAIDRSRHVLDRLGQTPGHLRRTIDSLWHAIDHLRHTIDSPRHAIDHLRRTLDRAGNALVHCSKGLIHRACVAPADLRDSPGSTSGSAPVTGCTLEL